MPTQRQINKAKADRAIIDASIAARKANPPKKTNADRAVDAQIRAMDSASAVKPKTPKKPVKPSSGNGGITGIFSQRTKNIDKYGGY